MPIYDFVCKTEECDEFDNEQERICKIGEVPICATCGESMQKLIRAPSGKRAPHVSWSTWRIGMGGNG